MSLCRQTCFSQPERRIALDHRIVVERVRQYQAIGQQRPAIVEMPARLEIQPEVNARAAACREDRRVSASSSTIGMMRPGDVARAAGSGAMALGRAHRARPPPSDDCPCRDSRSNTRSSLRAGDGFRPPGAIARRESAPRRARGPRKYDNGFRLSNARSRIRSGAHSSLSSDASGFPLVVHFI